jgi:hypothetical protein
MPAHATISRARLLALGMPGGPVYNRHLIVMARIHARAVMLLSNDMVNVRTGNLRASWNPPVIINTGSHVISRLTNVANYAAVVHDGQQAHDITSASGKMLKFTPAGEGAPIFRRVVHHPGTKARPFLRTAGEEVTGRPAVDY